MTKYKKTLNYKDNRPDHVIIVDWVTESASVLDLGCGDGTLLSLLVKEKNVRAQGIEIDEGAIYQCVAKGLNVIHGDIESGLSEYENLSFDYVILNQSLQQVRHFETTFGEALRVGKNVIVGLPNFAYYRARLQLFFLGRAPVTASLPYTWYESPNVHFFSIADFFDYCQSKGVKVLRRAYLGAKRRIFLFPNVFASAGLFLISK